MTTATDTDEPGEQPVVDPAFLDAWFRFTGEIIRVSIPERYRRRIKVAAERFAEGLRRIPW